MLDRIWRGHFPFLVLFIGYLVFVLFEASVLVLITRQIKRGGDVPQLRRYVGALIETSLPTVVLLTHMSNMGAAQALAFVGPLLYFVFIILSTLRLDFWLSAFTGFVASAELLGLAFLHPAAQTAAGEPTLATRLSDITQRRDLRLRRDRGCGRDAAAPAIRSEHRRRHRRVIT